MGDVDDVNRQRLIDLYKRWPMQLAHGQRRVTYVQAKADVGTFDVGWSLCAVKGRCGKAKLDDL